MDNNEVKSLIEAFKAYRELLTPIQSNLNDFIDTYDSMKDNIDKLNQAFGGDIKSRLETIYKTLSGQAEKAADLSSRIDQFTKLTNKYTAEVTQLVTVFSRVEERIASVNELERKAEGQISRLDSIIDEKNKSYNIKDLQRTLDSYNGNVQKVSEFINRDVADSLNRSQKKLENIKDGVDDIMRKQRDENISVEKLLETYLTTSETLKKIAEKEDVNEEYLFEVLDKWAENRNVRIKKRVRE
ncbi:MAG: hypothetical protein LBC13_00835 [Clostridiales bacterium]|jgi:DNA repair ATPase RecN|nr:hypothetical protein [Clostridiales bacterium]